MRHSIVMTFSRPKNIPIYLRYMRGQGVTWRPLCSQMDYEGFLYGTVEKDNNGVTNKRDTPKLEFPDEPWIKPWRCEMPVKARVDTAGGKSQNVPAVNPGNYLVDRFLDEMKDDKTFYAKDHYLSFLTDDCLWGFRHWPKMHAGMTEVRWDSIPGIDPKVEARWKEKTDTPHVIISAYKMGGNEMPATYARMKPGGDWSTWQRNSCRLYVTKCEVLTVRADFMRDVRFGPLWCSDGLLVEQLCEEHEGRLLMHNDSFLYPEAINPSVFGFAHHEGR
jgi:hypothetical protein